MRTRHWLVLVPLLAACGSASIAEPGRGSGTLSITAHAEVDNTVPNASSDDQFSADFTVRLTKGGLPVLGATVEIATGSGTVTLNPQADPGRYEARQAGYARTYTLSARLGDDYVEGVSLSGPPAHSFSAPIQAAQAASGQPLEVKWSPGDAAQATLSTRELDEITVPDTGSYTVPASGLKTADPGKTEDERVRVTRTSTIIPAGVTGDSRFDISIRNEVSIVIVGP